MALVVIAFASHTTFAQQTTLPLTDLSAFRKQAGNWSIVGNVSMDPTRDIHPPAQPEGKKQKKAPAYVSPVTWEPGQGILLNMNDEQKKDHLITTWEHGDIDIELEVMIPKGSNSGIYLQGRYEVQLLDSWGVVNPKFSDIGGIYRNWESAPGKIYMGKAPLTNPAKAPGLWQTLKISFQAPRFDAAGNKISNAKFIYVDLNGVRIHDHVEVPLPTGGPIENNEKATGPLMIQGDHGPVAFRNIRYQILKENNVTLSDIRYKTWAGNFKNTKDFISTKPAAEGTSQELTCEVLETEDAYGIVYEGNINIPADDQYEFGSVFTGGLVLSIDDRELINIQRGDAWEMRTAKIDLKAGKHSFRIASFKDASWMPPRLAFYAKTANSAPKELHAYNSYPQSDNPTSPILIDAGRTPKLLRAFLDFNGDRAQRLTHTIGVGESGMNYVFDLKHGNTVAVWRGDFVDATPMWNDRGDGSFTPRGAVQYTFRGQSLAALQSPNDPFPAEPTMVSKGYTIDEATNRPVFKSLINGAEIETTVLPADNNSSVKQTVVVKKNNGQSLYLKIAEAKQIQEKNGLFVVGDAGYFIRAEGTTKPLIRTINGVQELVVPVKDSFAFTIIW